jgi:hypothetical protein
VFISQPRSTQNGEESPSRVESTATVSRACYIRPLSGGGWSGVHDSNPLELFSFVIGELRKPRIGYGDPIGARGG